jgi:AbrB family looped-hinge helix DNA binding protein
MFLIDDQRPGNSRGTLNGMRTTIDSAGRIVIPKDLRTSLNLLGGDEVEIALDDGERLTLTPAPRKGKLRRGPHGIPSIELGIPPHGPEKVREELERVRR